MGDLIVFPAPRATGVLTLVPSPAVYVRTRRRRIVEWFLVGGSVGAIAATAMFMPEQQRQAVAPPLTVTSVVYLTAPSVPFTPPPPGLPAAGRAMVAVP